MARVRFATLPVKDPEEKKDYSFDWTAELERDGDSITVSAWVVSGGGLTQSVTPAPSVDGAITTVWYEAGTSGTDYVITNRITTTKGRIHEASAVLPCRTSG